MRTAKAVKTLLATCDGKEPTTLVGAIAHAKLETNSTTMGRSLKSARGVLDCLRTTRWDLFSAVARIEGERRPTREAHPGCRQLAQDRRTCPGWWTGAQAVRGRGPGDQAAHAAEASRLRRRSPDPPTGPPSLARWKIGRID